MAKLTAGTTEPAAPSAIVTERGTAYVAPVTTPAVEQPVKTNAEWLRENPAPDPQVAPRQYAEWLKSKPNPTQADLAQLSLLEKFNYQVPGLTVAGTLSPQQIEQQFSPSLSEVVEIKASDPSMAELSDSEVQRRVGIERLDRAGLLLSAGLGVIKHQLQGVDSTGKTITVNVDVDTYWDIMNLSPAERLPLLIQAGVLPEGYTAIDNVDAFNKQFGANLSPDAPYVSPELADYVTQVMQQEGSISNLQNAGLITIPDVVVPPEGSRERTRYTEAYWAQQTAPTVSPDAFVEAIENPTIMQSLEELGYVKNGKVSGTEGYTDASGKVYKDGLTVQEYAGFVQEQREWEAQFTPQQLEEIRSGRYMIKDFETGEFVPVTKEMYEERVALYEQYPEAGTSPGKISLPRAVEAKQELIDTVLSELRTGGFEVKTDTPSEPIIVGASPTTNELLVKNEKGEMYWMTATEGQVGWVINQMGSEWNRDIAPVPSVTAGTTYNIVGALQSGFDRNRLVAVFGDKAVRDSEQSIKDFALFDKYGSVDAMLSSKNMDAVNAGKRLQEMGKEQSQVLPLSSLIPSAAVGGIEQRPVTDKRWMNTRTGELYTDDERTKVIQLKPAARDEIVRNPASTGLYQWMTTKHPSVLESIPDKSVAQLSTEATTKLSALLDKAYEANLKWLAEKDPKTAKELSAIYFTNMAATTGIALGDLLNMFVVGFPGFVERWASNPSNVITDTGEGAHVVTELVQGLGLVGGGDTGKYTRQLQSNRGDVRGLVNDAIVARLMVDLGLTRGGIGARGLQHGKVVASGLAYDLTGGRFGKPYTPARSLSNTAATDRLWFKDSELVEMQKNGATDAQILAAKFQIELELARGAKFSEVNIGGKRYRVSNTEFQKIMGRNPDGTLSFYHTTPDITLYEGFERIPLYKDTYFTTKVVPEVLRRSYSGQVGDYPGAIRALIKDTPEIMADIALGDMRPYFKAGKGGQIEPEIVIRGKSGTEYGYFLEDIPGDVGAMSFDATAGPFQIKNMSLTRAIENPAGLKVTVLGKTGKGGAVVIGDIHGAPVFSEFFQKINSKFSEPIITGNPRNPATWHIRADTPNTGWTITQAGDLIGSFKKIGEYNVWRDTLNRLHDEAASLGVGRVERVLGNHEAAILAKDQIAGDPFTDAQRASLRPGIIDDIKLGRVKMAVDIPAENTLVTHAGVSLGWEPKFRGKTRTHIADTLNETLMRAVNTDKYTNKLFAKGRMERGVSHSYKTPQKEIGGPLWLRPTESTVPQLDLGFRQIVGHTPSDVVNAIYGKNFVIADVGVKGGKPLSDVYANTPYVHTDLISVVTKDLGSRTVPTPTRVQSATLMLKAMRDTVADFVLGWDGRIKAWDAIKANEGAVKALTKSLKEQIKERRAAGDSIGVKYLEKQIRELTSPTGFDYLYGGIDFWRDLVMGRQNSVKALNTLKGVATRPMLTAALGYVNGVRGRITQMSDMDVRAMFGTERDTVLRDLDTGRLSSMTDDALRSALEPMLERAISLVDRGLERSVTPYLDERMIRDGYLDRLQTEYNNYMEAGRVQDADYIPDEAIRELRTGRTPEPVAPRTPYAPRTPETALRELRTPVLPRTPSLRTPPISRTPVPPRTPTPARVPPTEVPPRTPVPPAPPRVPPPTRVPPTVPPPKTPPPVIKLRGRKGGKVAKIPDGSIAYKKGMFWKWIPPDDFVDGVKPRTLPRGVSPIGADLSGGNSPYTTIQMIGTSGARVPERISVDEGVTDAFITNYGTKISYGGKGEDTNVGERLPTTTKGMTVNGDGAVKGHAYARKVYPKHSVPRTAITDESTEPIRGGGVREVRNKMDRPYIEENTAELLEQSHEEETEDFGYEALDELGGYGEFGDEDPNWLGQGNQARKKKKKIVNRIKHKKIQNSRTDNPTVLRRLRP